jgi:hypothetical protein
MFLKQTFANVWHPHRRTCPFCGASKFGRSRRKGLFERVILVLTSIRPYRCDRCERRFYCWPGRPEQNRPAYQSRNSAPSMGDPVPQATNLETEIPAGELEEIIRR